MIYFDVSFANQLQLTRSFHINSLIVVYWHIKVNIYK